MTDAINGTATSLHPPKRRVYKAGRLAVSLDEQKRAAAELMEFLRRIEAADDPEAVQSTLEGETTLFDAIRVLLRHRDDLAALLKAAEEEERWLKARKAALKERIADAETQVAATLIELGVPENTLRMPSGELLTGLPGEPDEVVIDVTPSQLPEEFKAAEPAVRWIALTHRIREVLKAGGMVPDCRLTNGAPKLRRIKPRAK